MEGMNGIEFAKEIRRLKGNSVVIILITAFSIYEIADKEEVSTTVDMVIMKPFSLKNLDVILSSYLINIP
jgi:two-component SAPR family response regulator